MILIKNMKRIFFMIIALVLALDILAQGRKHSVFMELVGASNGVGMNFESRFSDTSSFGWRVGLAWGYGESSNFAFGGSESLRAYTVPIGVNWLIGRGRNQLELGAGVSLGLYNLHSRYYEYQLTGYVETEDGTRIPYYEGIPHTDNGNKFGYFLFGDIGYRHVSRKGFLFRIGISPSFNFDDSHGVSKSFFFPYLGFGYSF